MAAKKKTELEKVLTFLKSVKVDSLPTEVKNQVKAITDNAEKIILRAQIEELTKKLEELG